MQQLESYLEMLTEHEKSLKLPKKIYRNAHKEFHDREFPVIIHGNWDGSDLTFYEESGIIPPWETELPIRTGFLTLLEIGELYGRMKLEFLPHKFLTQTDRLKTTYMTVLFTEMDGLVYRFRKFLKENRTASEYEEDQKWIDVQRFQSEFLQPQLSFLLNKLTVNRWVKPTAGDIISIHNAILARGQ